MAMSLQSIRKRLQEIDNRKQNGSKSVMDNRIYPHWDIPENTTATLRFTPDLNEDNEFFWVERQMIKLPFAGIVGSDSTERVLVQVPCVEMYGKTEVCPIHAELREWYKDESLKTLANSYWKKRSYIFQGFVRSNPLHDDVTPENPIRQFNISPQLLPIIKAGLMDSEILELPTDYHAGLDFNVKKTKKGEYADYSTSTWSRRETPLSEKELAAIEKYGLYDLSSFLPKKPSKEELEVMHEMFSVSVEGGKYDPQKWGNYYKPQGLDSQNGSKQSSNDEPQMSKKETPPSRLTRTMDDEPAMEEHATREPVVIPSSQSSPSSSSSETARMILEQLKARKK